MCGIAGYTRTGGVFPNARIHRALDDLVHRGPDERGTYESKSVALGHARLRIIDLVSGRQPIVSDDKDVVIVFNGEIYNYRELRDELTALGHQFRTQSDTEVILHGFLEWDTACFTRLRGMFAFAIWSESKKRLLLVRDRVGIKPLYFYRHGSDIFFGSELKAILVHPEVRRELDLDALNCYLSLNYVPQPYTLVKDLAKLPPGHWLEWRNGAVSTQAYWQLDREAEQHTSRAAAVERLDDLLARSVREHLISDVPLGVWLSGGLDSSTILHYAAAAAPGRRISTFSVSFEGRSCDESRYFREVASRYGTEHVEFDLNPELDLPDAIEQIPYYHDEPGADAGALPVWFLARMSRQNVTVVLSGEGADELFGGYLTYFADRIVRPLRAAPAPLRRLGLRLLRYWPVSDDKISLEYKAKRFLEGSLLPASEAHCFWNGSMSEPQKRALWAGADPDPLRRLLRGFEAQAPHGRGLNQHLFFDQCYSLPDGILAKVDRMSMAHSLEVRPPFLDHRIIEFAASLPCDLKIRGTKSKYLLRELMKDRLPASVLQRKKEGFDIPAHEWFRGPLRPLLLDTITRDAVEQTNLFRWEGVQALINAHLERRANVGYQLWGLLMLQMWMRRWNIQPQPALERSVARRARVTVAGD